ncbi:hypothetical protein [Hyphomicrobium sp. MC8b]|jgi:hypothetical protein|uniref:hypothetical protein n=1 Tax=unclassified Hyphomicrobium TaxID=2619925 RepID=UPI003919B25B
MRMIAITEFFDRLCLDRHFANDASGDTLVFPFARRGRGYLLPADKETGVRRALRVQIIASWIAMLSFCIFGVWMTISTEKQAWHDWLAIVSWLAFIIAYLIYSRFSLVRGLARA